MEGVYKQINNTNLPLIALLESRLSTRKFIRPTQKPRDLPRTASGGLPSARSVLCDPSKNLGHGAPPQWPACILASVTSFKKPCELASSISTREAEPLAKHLEVSAVMDRTELGRDRLLKTTFKVSADRSDLSCKYLASSSAPLAQLPFGLGQLFIYEGHIAIAATPTTPASFSA